LIAQVKAKTTTTPSSGELLSLMTGLSR